MNSKSPNLPFLFCSKIFLSSASFSFLFYFLLLLEVLAVSKDTQDTWALALTFPISLSYFLQLTGHSQPAKSWSWVPWANIPLISHEAMAAGMEMACTTDNQRGLQWHWDRTGENRNLLWVDSGDRGQEPPKDWRGRGGTQERCSSLHAADRHVGVLDAA